MSGLILSATLLCVFSGFAAARESGGAAETTGAAAQGPDIRLVVRTGNPRETLQSWLEHTRQAENLAKRSIEEPTHANLFQSRYNTRRLLAHLDLSQAPAAVRNEAGIRATYALQDILLRVKLPPMEEVPDWGSFDDSAPGKWRLPGTPIIIARMEEGPRAGEYLISASSVAL